MRTEPCVCGGRIVVESKGSVIAAVALHNTSVSHILWRFQREALVPGPERSTATVRVCDVSTREPGASTPPVRA